VLVHGLASGNEGGNVARWGAIGRGCAALRQDARANARADISLPVADSRRQELSVFQTALLARHPGYISLNDSSPGRLGPAEAHWAEPACRSITSRSTTNTT
jgi:hypothetical protein